MTRQAAADIQDKGVAPAPAGKPVSPVQQEKAPAAPALVPAAPAAAGHAAFRLRPIPILVTALLAYGLPLLSGLMIDFASDHIRLPSVHGGALPYNFLQHGVLFVLALVAIAIAKRVVPADYGLHQPRGESYAVQAVYWGLAFGILMAFVDFAPEILARAAPKFDDPLTRGNVLGWLAFQGIYAGPTDEVLNRALLVGYLAAAMPGRLRLARFDMSGAGIVVAVILACGGITNFIVDPFAVACGKLAYTLAMGIVFAYWFDRSKSVLAPVVAHNISGLTKYLLMFSLIAAWR